MAGPVSIRLWGRLALAMTLASTAPALGVGAWATRQAMQAAEEESQARLRREAQLHAGLVGQWMRDRTAQAEAWTQVFPNRLESLSDELRSGFLAAVYRGTPSAVVVVLVDGDGRAVVPPVHALTGGDRVPADARRAQALIDRLPLTEAVATGQAVGAAWLPDGLGTLPSVPVAVVAGQGLEGPLVLGLELRVEAAAEMVSGGRPGHAVVLLDERGDAIAGAGQGLVRADLLRPLVHADADFRYGRGDSEVLGSIVPVPGSPWSTAVLEPAADVLRPAVEVGRNAAGTALLSALVAAVVSFVVAGTLSRPVERLRDAALELARGRRSPTEVHRSDEIGELARAFDHMADELDEQRRSIEAFNEELQGRVEERTRQLEAAQAELVRSEQLAAVAQVGAGLAHELNNPLAAVLGLAQYLRARHADEPLLADLEAEAARCRDVVGVMLRLAQGEVDPGQAPVVDLRDVLVDVYRLVMGAFEQRGVALELCDTGSAPLAVRVDRGSAGRIIGQALQAMRSGLDGGASVKVRAHRQEEGEQTYIDVDIVSDRPQAEQGARRDDRMAAGLDLWVARQLIDRFHGRLDERVQDGGAVWRLRFPEARS